MSKSIRQLLRWAIKIRRTEVSRGINIPDARLSPSELATRRKIRSIVERLKHRRAREM